MVAGHLSEKKGYFYAVLTYYDRNGKRKFKWIPTGLPVKGNKKKAEAFLQEARCNFKPKTEKLLGDDILFADYMEQWLEIVKSTISISTYCDARRFGYREVARSSLQNRRFLERTNLHQ